MVGGFTQTGFESSGFTTDETEPVVLKFSVCKVKMLRKTIQDKMLRKTVETKLLRKIVKTKGV